MEKVLVTGANGMLAANIIEQLAENGYTVYATLRKGKRYPGKMYSCIHIEEADFKDTVAAAALVRKCDTVIHVAAMTSQSCKDYSRFREINVEASRNLAMVSAENGVKSFIYVSTANTIGYGSDESHGMMYPFTKSLYATSKKEAEDAVLEFSEKMRTVIVNPTFMIGKYSSPTGSGRVVSMVRRSLIIACPSGGKNVISTEEAARGIIMAMQKGRNREKYLICGKNYTYEELFRRIAKEMGLRRKFIAVPDTLLETAGRVGDLLSRSGINTEITSTNMRTLMIRNFYNTDKAFTELGFKAEEHGYIYSQEQ